ncbi:hypothetical protein APSETT444_004331 [Aspergillus pseudonomiae]
MFVRNLKHIKPHPDLQGPLPSGRTKHAKTRLILHALIHPPITHQRIPRLRLMLLRRIGVHIRHLAPGTPGQDIKLQHLPCVISNPHNLPLILHPRLNPLHNDIRPEPLHANRVYALLHQPRIQLRHRRLRGNQHWMHIGEIHTLRPSQQPRVPVAAHHPRRRALINETDVTPQERAKRAIDLRPVDVGVRVNVPDLDLAQGRPRGIWTEGHADLLVSNARERNHQELAVRAESGVDERHLRDLPDGQEIVRVGVDEHPPPVEV